jgi:hypothetical protein
MSKAVISLGLVFVTLVSITWFRLEQFRLGYDVAHSLSSFRRSEDTYRLKLITYAKRTGLPTLHSVAQVESDLVQPESEQIIRLRAAF